MGRERLTQTKFSKEAKFEEAPYQTEDKIKERYIELAKQQAPSSKFEVDLMLDENTDKLRRLRDIVSVEEYLTAVENLNPEDKNYLVFVRRLGDL